MRSRRSWADEREALWSRTHLGSFSAGGRYAIGIFSNLRLNSVANSLIGMIAGAGLIYLLGVAGKLVFKKEAMGFGDVKLMGMIGALLGIWFVILVFFIAPILGVVFGLVVLATKGEHHIPYGPFLSMAAAIMMIWGPEVFGWVYQRVYPVAHLLWAG